MSTRVPLRWPIPQKETIKIGRAVSSPTILDIASAANWALGRGAQLIPETGGSELVLAAGVRHTFGFRVEPRFQSISRLWRVNLYDGGTATIASPSGGTDLVAGFGVDWGLAEPVGYVEFLASQSAAKADLTLDITPKDNPLKLAGISCVEIPRIDLFPSPATDQGFDVTQLRGNAPITADIAASPGDNGLSDLDGAVNGDAGAIGRRVGHFYWAVPHELDGVETTVFAAGTTSGTLVDILLLDVPMLQRRKFLGSTGDLDANQRDLKVAGLFRATDGTTSGEVTWTATSGDAVTVAIPTGTSTWTYFEGDLAVDVEDTSTEDGLRGASVWDDVQQQFRRTAGAGTIHCASLCAWEPG